MKRLMGSIKEMYSSWVDAYEFYETTSIKAFGYVVPPVEG